MRAEPNPSPAAPSPSAAGSSAAASAPAAVAPAAAAEQGQGVVVLYRGLRGPFDGLIFYLPNGSWLFVHCNGAPLIVATSLELLIKRMRELGYLDEGELYLELYLECRRMDDPIIPLSSVSFSTLLAFEKGEITLEEVASATAGGESP
ncbi:MAG: hypothetical protein QXJ21_09735 [Thermofilum sp.]